MTYIINNVVISIEKNTGCIRERGQQYIAKKYVHFIYNTAIFFSLYIIAYIIKKEKKIKDEYNSLARRTHLFQCSSLLTPILCNHQAVLKVDFAGHPLVTESFYPNQHISFFLKYLLVLIFKLFTLQNKFSLIEMLLKNCGIY